MATTDFTPKFVNYPEVKQGPDVQPDQHHAERKHNNPSITGWFLVVAAFLIETFTFVRNISWRNSGFDSLRSIFSYLELCEPCFNPIVIPIAPLSDQSSNLKIIPKPKAQSYGYYSVADYQDLYASGELTPIAVVKAILPLIRRDNSPPGEHSIAWIDSRIDLILAAAEASTLRWKEKSPLSLLDGVPTAVKDDYDVKGYITTLGAPPSWIKARNTPVQTETNWCVQKLEDAGAINLGKLSMHEFGLDTSGANSSYGTPPNPYNPKYYPGGSSSGTAYAVSAGLIPIALGSDGGGSIRIPASFCSVYGLKPTHGRLSFKPGMNHSTNNAVNAPLAIDIASLALLYSTIGVPDNTSNFPAPSPSPFLSLSATRPKIIGLPEVWFCRATPAIQSLCRSFLDRLVKSHDYIIIPITIPFLSEGQIAHALTILTDAATLLPDTKHISSANKILVSLGTVTPASDYLLAQKLRNLLMQHLANLWQEHPGMIIVTPTTACAGWPIRSKSELKFGICDGDVTMKTMEYVWMANFCGVPALSVPVGFVGPEGGEKDGQEAGEEVKGKIPVGMMGMGEWAGEEQLLGWGVDCEDIGKDRMGRPPIWVDVIARAREEMKRL